MIQILGLREQYHTLKKRVEKREVFHEKGWYAPDIRDLFNNLDAYLEKIPIDEHYNLFYTLANCFEGDKSRQFKSTDVIGFDIDDIDVDKAEETARVCIESLKLKFEDTAVIFTGGGVQFLVYLTEPIDTPEFFEDFRGHYKIICQKMRGELEKAQLIGSPDSTVFDNTRLFRLPNTMSKKPKKRADALSYFIQSNMNPVTFELTEASGMVDLNAVDYIPSHVFKAMPDPDEIGIRKECLFIKHTIENAESISEPQWYAMLSIVARFEDGRELAHKWSKKHPQYNKYETDAKFDQARFKSGPRKCESINTIWDGCKDCKHFGTKLVSPISIQGESFIKTSKNGFYNIVEDAEGKPKLGKPNYEDLRRHYDKTHKYITTTEAKHVYTFRNTHWYVTHDTEIEAYANEKFKPKPSSNMRYEFKALLECTNLERSAWFNESSYKKINFKNGILDLKDLTFQEEHSPQYGFKYVLPYAYDPLAKAPRFDDFMDEIMCGRNDLVRVLEEFMGYAFSGDECWLQKALLFTGGGDNGKSTFINVLAMLAGDNNYSSLNLEDLKDDQKRYEIDGKLFNLSEETPRNALKEPALFKTLVTGGETMIKVVYKKPFKIKNRTKLIFSCNEIPDSLDTTDSLFRRMVIIPFDANFRKAGTVDIHIIDKLEKELPGIFNVVIAGYQRLLEQKKLTNSKYINEKIETYKKEVDYVYDWQLDNIKILSSGDETPIKKDEIYQAYKLCCERDGQRILNNVHFFRRLKKYIPQYEKRNIRISGQDGSRCWKLFGVSLLYEFGQ